MKFDLWSASFHFCLDPDPESLLQTGIRLEGSEVTFALIVGD